MRAFKIIGLAGFALLGVSSILVVKSAMAIEKVKYAVLEKEDGFEIRRYDPQIVAETFVEGDLEKAGNEGFRRLYAYISGENTKKQSISMTAPVSQATGPWHLEVVSKYIFAGQRGNGRNRSTDTKRGYAT
jgi:hypothetical protein